MFADAMDARATAGAPPPRRISVRAQNCLVAASLLLLTACAYEGVRHLGFLRYDDDLFVTQNPWVRQGLGARSLRWALQADLVFDSPYADYWAPITVLSRMLDVELFGMAAAGHHLSNFAFHALNVVLAFLVLRKLTGRLWPGALAAAILAVHPLHVESVAWVTERKDVLSLLFWLAALAAYAGWVRAPARGRWALVVLAFAFGLLSKPSVVTLPVVLLLLDRWPLGRKEPWTTLVREKWLLFVLSASSVVITVAANLHVGLVEGSALPLRFRMANALDAYVAYLADVVWPAGLGVGHVHRGAALPWGRLVFCIAVLATLTGVAVRLRRSRPYLLVGWLWFLATLAPTIGLLQSGVQGRADRFMYIPLLGLSLAAGMLADAWARDARARGWTLGAVAAAVVLALVPVTRAQVRHWHDDLSLFRRAVAVDPASPIGANGLGAALAATGDLDGGERELRRALRLKPDFLGALMNLASLRMGRGAVDEAATLVEQALDTWAAPGTWARAEALFDLALVRTRQGRALEALDLYGEVVRLDPRHWAALYNAGNLLAAQGRLEDAGASYAASLRWNRDHVDAYRNLGLVRLLQRRVVEAIAWLVAGLEVDPANASLHTSLGRALLAAGRPADALRELRAGVQLAPAAAEAHFQLAEALRAGGAAAEAREHYRTAARLDPSDARALAALQTP